MPANGLRPGEINDYGGSYYGFRFIRSQDMSMSLTKQATHEIQGYTLIIPKIQNVYPVDKARNLGWEFGFKYESGVFEFFAYKTKTQAKFDRLKLLVAIDNFYAQ